MPGPAYGCEIVALEQRIGDGKNWLKVEVKDHGIKYLPIQKNGKKLFRFKGTGSALYISVNGTFGDVAFNNIEAPTLAPAFSGHGKFCVNFGDRPFKHAPPDEKYISVRDAHASTLVQTVPALEDFALAPIVHISGAIGYFADRINGSFAPTQEKSLDGRIVYCKQGDTSICIEHFHGEWQLKRLLHKQLDVCYAFAPGGCALEASACTFAWKEQLWTRQLDSLRHKIYKKNFFKSFIKISTEADTYQQVGICTHSLIDVITNPQSHNQT